MLLLQHQVAGPATGVADGRVGDQQQVGGHVGEVAEAGGRRQRLQLADQPGERHGRAQRQRGRALGHLAQLRHLEQRDEAVELDSVAVNAWGRTAGHQHIDMVTTVLRSILARHRLAVTG